jgi:protein-S-isoprenylcysteine O-methyltransferase Ste14
LCPRSPLKSKADLISWSGLDRLSKVGTCQVAGVVIGSAGALLALWCILTFAFAGRGIPFPLDASRQLVTGGPFRFVRNPIYIGATLALAGFAITYKSWSLMLYSGFFLLLMHGLIILYEEPALTRGFGEEYERYCQRVGRWLPVRS